MIYQVAFNLEFDNKTVVKKNILSRKFVAILVPSIPPRLLPLSDLPALSALLSLALVVIAVGPFPFI